jgi:hypothetical protein
VGRTLANGPAWRRSELEDHPARPPMTQSVGEAEVNGQAGPQAARRCQRTAESPPPAVAPPVTSADGAAWPDPFFCPDSQ